MDRARTFLAGVKSNGNLIGMGRRYDMCFHDVDGIVASELLRGSAFMTSSSLVC